MNFHFKVASFLAKLLDNQFRIFKWRFGIDPILGFFPIIGDLIPLLISFYLIWIGTKMHIPQGDINKMILNALVDVVLGFIPFVGDLIDFSYKAHERNMKILEKYK